METMEASEDLFECDVASARAVVRVRKAGTPKLASTFGEHNSNSKHKITASISSSTADRLQQMAIATAAGEGNSAADRGHNAEDQSDDAAAGVTCDTCQRRTRSMSCTRSQTPLTEEGDSVADAARHVPQPKGVLTRPASFRTSKGQPQKTHFHANQHKQQQLVDPLQDQLHQKEDQAGDQSGQLVAARASSPAAVDSNDSVAGQPRTGAGGSLLLGLQAEQPGSFIKENCQRTSEVNGAQQQVSMAAADQPLKQRRKPRRLLKPSAGVDSFSAPVEQQQQQVSGSRLSAEEHRVSLDEPFQTIGWPAPVSVLQQQARFQLVQQQQPVAVTWPKPAVQDASAPAAGLRTRLSMRSVAYLEDLLEQTAQAAGSVKADGGKETQPHSSTGVRAASAQIGAALSGRLSVGNLIISPPISRAASMHPAAGGSSASKAAGATDAVQAAFRRAKSPAAAKVQPGDAGVQSLVQVGLSRLPGRSTSQHLLQRGTVSATAAAAQASSAAHGSDGTANSSVDDSASEQAPDVWTAAAGAGGVPATAGAAAKLQNQKRVSYSSDTCSSPGSESPVCKQGRIRAFAPAGAPAGLLPGGLCAGALQSFGSGFQGQAGGAYGAFPPPRKSDRQLGLETVQRIDAIFRQQSRPLQGLTQAATAANNSGTPVASEAGAAGQQNRIAVANGSSTPVAASAAADQGELIHDERCTVAALCRGLRFDGDITLKEVAMAFQLRDAYDWDEDLEAASKAKAIEDPRLKGPRLLSCSPSLSNSSVCPDPEPVSGFFPRSTWMAGNGGASPLASISGVRPTHSGQEYHPGAAGGLAPALVQRLHMQSSNGIASQPGSVSSSRRASLANSPINLPGHDGPHQPTGLPPAALHAAVSQQLQQQGARGWAALMPGMDSDQAYPYMQARGAGRGRGRKRKNADDSDDDYDPRKPSHQQEVYQRKHIDRRAQQQFHQQRMCSRISRYGYSYQAMQQACSAAAMQQAYMMQAASRSGPGLSMQQVQHIQQLQYMQQQAQLAMAAMDEQAAAAAAGVGIGYEEPDGALIAVPAAAGSVQPHTSHSAMQSPINGAAYVKEQFEQRHLGVQQLQAANQGQQSAMQQQQQQHYHQQQERPLHVQPSPQQQQQAGVRQQAVRRPSYVKRRLTADDAADWLQNNAPGGLLFHRQLGPPRLDLGDTHGRLGGIDDHDMTLQILSPTAVRPPPGLAPYSQQLTDGLGGSFSRPGGRLRRRTLAGLEYDIIHGHIHIGDGSTDDDEMDSDVSDPDDEVCGLGVTGGRRGGRASRGGRGTRGGRGRGRGRSSSLAMEPAASPQRAAAPNDTTASPGGSCVHSGTRGRGRSRAGARGRSSAARGRSCLSSVALASKMDAVAAPAPDGPQQQVSNGVQPPSAAGEAPGAAANGAAGSEAARARGRGRGRGRGRASNGSAAATAGWGDGSAGSDGSTGGRRGRGTGGRGRGRVGRPPLSSYAAAPRAIAAAFPGQQQHADLAGDAAAYISTTNGLSGQKKQKLDRLDSGVRSTTAAAAQQPVSQPAAAPAKQGLASMPSWFPAGLAPEPKPSGTDRAGTLPPLLTLQRIPQMNHLVQKHVGPSRSLQLARASPALIEQEGQQQDGAAMLLAAGPAGGQSHQDHLLQQQQASWGLGAPPSCGAGAQYVQNGDFIVEEPAQDLSDGMNDTMMTDLACHESLLWSLVHTGEDCSKDSWRQA